MKKSVFTLLLCILVLASTCITVFAAPGDKGVTWSGATTEIKSADLKDGATVELSLELTADTAYKYFSAANIAIICDPAILKINYVSASGDGYAVNGLMVKADNSQYNAVVSNLAMAAPQSGTGYCCTVKVNVSVVDAAALEAAGSTKVTVGYVNDDVTVNYDGVMYSQQEYLAQMSEFNIPSSFTPMTLTVEGSLVNTWSVSFNTNGGSAINPINVEKGQSTTLPNPSRTGYIFNGWYADAALTTKITGSYTPTADVTLYAGWTKVNYEYEKTVYTVTFVSNGGNNCDPMSADAGNYIALPAPAREGYTFKCWCFDASLKSPVVSPYKPTANITLYADWTKNEAGEVEKPDQNIYTISFIANGGSACENMTVIAGEYATLPTPIRTGYTFNGWKSDSALQNAVLSPYKPTESITLYADWTEVDTGDSGDTTMPQQYIVTFDTNGGTPVSAVIINAGEAITLTYPTKSGYTFAGWYTDEALITKVSTATYTPVSNIMLYAKWTAAIDNTHDVPNTGLNSNIPMIIIVMALLVCGAVAIIFVRYRNISKKK